MTASSDVTRESIAEWQKHLLQLDRRNNLLYFREGRSSVRIAGENVDFKIAELAASKHGLKFLYAERRSPGGVRTPNGQSDDSGDSRDVYTVPGDIETPHAPIDLQRRLKNLRRTEKEWRDEQAIGVLFLATGFLTWIDEDGEEAMSPLLLVPCELTQVAPRTAFVLQRDADAPVANVTLDYRLSQSGLLLPDIASDEPPSAYLSQIERLVRGRPGWSVKRELILTTFQYSKMAMWQDLEQLRQHGVEQPLVRALAGDINAATPDPSSALSASSPDEEGLAGGRLDDSLDPRTQFLVLPADSSQVLAIEAARSGHHLLIDGPPGTGKSQTIVNIVATLLADGKKVLFVSEKSAALDVVKRRLEECDLGIFCLDLHGQRGKQASVYDQLSEALDSDRRIARVELDYSRLVNYRHSLNQYVRSIHEKRQPIGKTPFEMHGLFAQLRELPDVRFDVPDPLDLTIERLGTYRQRASRLKGHQDEFATHRTNRWRALRPVAARLGLPDDIRRDLRQVQEVIQLVASLAQAACAEMGVRPPECARDLVQLRAIAEHLAGAPGVPERWLDASSVRHLLALASSRQQEQERRMSLEAAVSSHFGTSRPSLDAQQLASELASALSSASVLARVLGPSWRARVIAEATTLVESAQEIGPAVGATIDAAQGLAESLGSVVAHSRRDLADAVDWAAKIATLSPIPEPWLDPAVRLQIRDRLGAARRITEELAAAEARLLGEYDDELVQLVDLQMLIRYRADYRSVLHRMRGQFRRDQRTLRGLKRTPGKISLEEAVSAIETGILIGRLRSEWQEIASALPGWLGARYQGRDSNWIKLDAELDQVEELLSRRPQPRRARELLIDEEAAATLRGSLDGATSSLSWLTGAEELLFGAGRQPAVDDTLDSTSEDAREILQPLRQLLSIVELVQPFLVQPIGSVLELSALLDATAALTNSEREEQELGPSLRDDFRARYAGLQTDWRGITAALGWTTQLVSLAGDPISAELRQHAANPRPSDVYLDLIQSVRELEQRIESMARILDQRFSTGATPWPDWGVAPFRVLADWVRDLSLHADEAVQWLQYRGAVDDLEQLLGLDIVNQITELTGQANLAPGIIERRVLRSWLDALYASEPGLRDFRTKEHEAVIAEFRNLDKQFLKAARNEIRKHVFDRYPTSYSTLTQAGEVGTLRGQLSKKRNRLPVRRLFTRIPSLLQTLKPCLMTSPLAVSQLLPRDRLASETLNFDTVIFDEASQVFPEDAIPSLVRARQAIVVGDEQQLPPTNFFRKAFAEQEESDEDELVSESNALKGRDSILGALDGMIGRGVQKRSLRVHYRSRHENLIRFSNHHFYRDRLLIFPSPYVDGADLGLLSVYLSDARYDAGANKHTNKREAEEVAERVFALMRTRPLDESIGVVALSRDQATCIDDLIQQRRAAEPDVDARFSEDATEPFFVKNLERVQGDERDHIILSVGYGPTTGSGAVPNRFGPLNSEGGDRRLNVAVSRAKKSMTVVHSLRPDQIRSEQRGALLLRRFLEYIRNPRGAFEAQQRVDPTAETESPFEESIRRALLARGHKVQPQVGVAGYRIDLAVYSEDQSRFDLGIECDGWTYHSSPAARDRDWLRQDVLEGLGWAIHRVWSTAWVRNPEGELKAIEAALDDARIRSGQPVSPTAAPSYAPAQAAEDIWKPEDGVERAPGMQESTEPANSLPESLFQPYCEASLTGFSHGPDLQYEVQRFLEPMLIEIAKIEGPVHLETAVERLRTCYGMSRARQPSRERVLSAIRLAARAGRLVVEQRGGSTDVFFTLPERDDADARRPSATGGRRLINRIAPSELEKGVQCVARSLFGATRDELVRETARCFGYERTGGDISQYLGSAVDRLVRTGQLIESFGKLCFPA